MPKDDASYDYSSTKLDRTKAGKLLISDMANRSTPSSYDGTKDIPVTLTPSYDGNYMIVGNPFMAPLNVQDFLNANAETLEKRILGRNRARSCCWNRLVELGPGNRHGAFDRAI